MVVAVVAMRMVQMSVDHVVDMIAMRDRFVPATGSMLVVGVVATAIVCRCAGVWIDFGHFQLVLFDLAILANMVQMTVVQVIDVSGMFDSGVSAIGAMLVIVVVVCVGHFSSFLGFESQAISIACMTAFVTKREM